MKKALFSTLAVVSGSSFAAVDPAITTAIGTMQTDAVTVAAAFTVAIIAVVAIKFLRKGL